MLGSSPDAAVETGRIATERAAADEDITQIAIGYFIGAALMTAGGVVEAFLGVRVEGRSLESIAQPRTVEDADTDASGSAQPQHA